MGSLIEAAEAMPIDNPVLPDDPLVLKSKKRRKKRPSGVAKRHKVENSGMAPDFEPRSYQLEVLGQVLKENTIVFLETGAGKTHIAAMLLDKLADRLSIRDEKRIGVFLTPTVALADQQANVISSSTKLKVGVYHGDTMDAFDAGRWIDEIAEHQVMVMTAQILFNALQISAITIDMIEVLIFDECHNADKNHPYASIMKSYYHTSTSKSKPRIFGMTGSLVATKASTAEDGRLHQQMRDLESLLDARIYTVSSREEIEENVPTPSYRSQYYDQPYHTYKELRLGLSNLFVKHETELKNSSRSCMFSDETKRRFKSLRNAYDTITTCLVEYGLWSAVLAIEILLKNDLDANLEDDFAVKLLKDAHKLLNDGVPADSPSSLSTLEDAEEALKRGLIASKIIALVKVLVRYTNAQDFRCMVFVDRVIVTQLLVRLLERFTCIGFIRAAYIVGVTVESNTTKHLQTLKTFQSGEINLLICTSVAEEGLDVQACNCVVRFDLPRTVRSFVQSRGRARKREGDYLFLIERGNLQQEDLLIELFNSEKLIKAEALSRMSKPVEIVPLIDPDMEFFYTSSGTCISTDGSVSLVYKFCSLLGVESSSNRQLHVDVSKCSSDGEYLFTCVLIFPPTAPIREVKGSPRRSKMLAKRSACLEACRQLDSLGVLSEALEGKVSQGPALGSTKRKELFPSVKSSTYQRQWITTSSDISLHAYALTFYPDENDDDTKFTNFVLLFDAAIDDDVGNIEVTLHLSRSRSMKAVLSSAGQRHFGAAQLAAAKAYQEIIFNGAFSRLVFRENMNDRTLAMFLLSCPEKSKDLWSETYLLLPRVDGSCDVDWKIVNGCAEAARLLPALCSDLNMSEVRERPDTSLIYTANGPVSPEELRDAVVLTVHTGKLFTVVEVLDNVAAQSMFKEDEKALPCTYDKFFMRKHGRKLRYQMQPFLRVKPTHAVHNHLHEPDMNNTKKASVKAANFVELPPELCIVLGAKRTLIRSLYLIPSFMYRFTAYVISSELRAFVTKHCPCASASKILEAITSVRCQEGFSYEALEMLGDSVLKYAVTRKLFLTNSTMHEGDMSDKRIHAIRNSTLRELAVAHDLPMYIRDEPFYPNTWVGAGMFRQRSKNCRCQLDNLVTKESGSLKFSDTTIYVGKTCGAGHRWMCSKTTSDVLEALIGAYTVGGGFYGALEFMKAMHLDVEFESSLIAQSLDRQVVPSDMIKNIMGTLVAIEQELGYTFRNKALLLEAITHPSVESDFCYQRLEFIGDAVLDFLVTKHLFTTHPGLSPGFLSDLRAASVNNDCLARVAVKHRLHSYLRCNSSDLREKISTFVEGLKKTPKGGNLFGFKALAAPKALADMVESIAGAILVDSGFDLDKLWVVLKRLLSPLVTPATMPLHPVREFIELCAYKNWKYEWIPSLSDATLELSLKVGRETFTETSTFKNRKDARKDAAEKMLTFLKTLGHSISRLNEVNSPPENGSEMIIQGQISVAAQKKMEVDMEIDNLVAQVSDRVDVSLTAIVTTDFSKSAVELLEEFCSQRKIEKPKFISVERRGITHGHCWFSYTVSVEVPGKGLLEQRSSFMANKTKAMENAAEKMLQHFVKSV